MASINNSSHLLELPLDGLRRVLERFDGNNGVVGVCGPRSVHFRDYENPRMDATIYKICFEDKTVVSCHWENKEDSDKELLAVSRVPGGNLSDKSYLSIVDLMNSVCVGHSYKIPSFEQDRIYSNSKSQGK